MYQLALSLEQCMILKKQKETIFTQQCKTYIHPLVIEEDFVSFINKISVDFQRIVRVNQ